MRRAKGKRRGHDQSGKGQDQRREGRDNNRADDALM